MSARGTDRNTTARRRPWWLYALLLLGVGLGIWIAADLSKLSSAERAADRAWGRVTVGYSNRHLTVVDLLEHISRTAPQQRAARTALSDALNDAMMIVIPPRDWLRQGPELAKIEATQRALATAFAQARDTLHGDPLLVPDPRLAEIEAEFAARTAAIAQERASFFAAMQYYNKLQERFPSSIWASLGDHQPVVGMTPADGPLPP